ncbi:DUF4054 domain-containing protein [Immundisolibacter sp.]
MPIAITSTDITNVAPELSTQANERIELFIEYARLFVNEAKWEAKAKFGTILYCCHLLTLATRGGAGGSVASEKVGELQVNYSTPQTDVELNSTSYGQMFLQLRKTLPFTPLVV